jgi:hypothetical protein
MKKPLLTALILVLASAAPLSATVIYSQDFTGLSSLPAGYAVTAPTNTSAGVSASVGNPAASMILSDGSSSGTVNVGIAGASNGWSTFTTSNATTRIFKVDFDWYIKSSLSSGAANFRFSANLGGSSATTATIGFGRALVNATNMNFFYAGAGNAPTPSLTNAIGWNGSSWESGFNFGTYDGTNAANNTSGGFYNFSLSYVDQATTAQLMVTSISNPWETANFTITGLGAATVTQGRRIDFLSGTTQVGAEGYIDNIVVSAVPEPSAALLVALGLGVVLALRSRRNSHRKAH